MTVFVVLILTAIGPEVCTISQVSVPSLHADENFDGVAILYHVEMMNACVGIFLTSLSIFVAIGSTRLR